jgi:hypothetical protein
MSKRRRGSEQRGKNQTRKKKRDCDKVHPKKTSWVDEGAVTATGNTPVRCPSC